MKITNETKKTIVIKEVDVTESLVDLESAEILDLNQLIKEQYNNGDCVKVTIVRVIKEEE